MTFQRKEMGDVIVLIPARNLVGGDETNALLSAIEAVTAAGRARVVIDLGETTWISSLGVGFLRRASMICNESGGWLRLARIAKVVEKTLTVMGLFIYFETFETVEEAAIAPEKAHRPGHNRQNVDPPKHPGA